MDKPVYQSKTLWVALVTAIAAFFPSVQALISAHPEGFGMVMGGLFAGLRLISKGKVTIS